MAGKLNWTKAQEVKAEYSPSSRAACRLCGDKIAIKSLRIGLGSDNQFGDDLSFKYYHPDCIPFFPSSLSIDDMDVSEISKEDVEYLEELMDKSKQKGAKKGSKKKVKEKEKKGAKNKKKNESDSFGSDSDYSEEEIPSKKRKGGTRSTSKSSKKKKKVETSSESEEESDKEPPKKLTAKQKKEWKQVQAEMAKLEGKPANDLKEKLRQNNQPCTGKKAELVERVADGRVRGTIPKCPKCFGGNLKYFAESAVYNCKGFMDDDVYRRCSAHFKAGEIQRGKWKD